MAYVPPTPCDLPKSAVDVFGADVARGLQYIPGQDLLPVVEAINGRIVLQDIFETNLATSGSIRVEPDGRFTIFLAAHTGAVRDRFTIAHELGHLFLHFHYNRQKGIIAEEDGLDAKRYGSGPVEWEANWFAAGFLMPASAFREQYALLDGNVPALASFFGVSVKSTEIRIEYLGLDS